MFPQSDRESLSLRAIPPNAVRSFVAQSRSVSVLPAAASNFAMQAESVVAAVTSAIASVQQCPFNSRHALDGNSALRRSRNTPRPSASLAEVLSCYPLGGTNHNARNAPIGPEGLPL